MAASRRPAPAPPRRSAGASRPGPLRAALVAGSFVVFGLVAVVVLIKWDGGREDGPTGAPTAAPSRSPTPEPSETEPPPPATYDVTLVVPAGATVDPAVLRPQVGEAVTELPYARAEGQRFVGWFPSEDPAAERVDNATLRTAPIQAATTLHARFEPKPVAVDYASHGLPILMYHHFYDPAAGEVGEDGNWMDIRLFDEQVKWLVDDGWYFPTWDEADAYLRGDVELPAKSIILTSDDGLPSLYSLAIPTVLKHGAKLTGFVVVKDFDPAHLAEYDDTKIFFQSHSYDMHPGTSDGSAKLVSATAEEIADDVARSTAVLGTKVAFCVPYGKSSDTAKQGLAAAGVRLALLIENAKAYPMMDPMSIPRLRMSDGISLDTFIHILTTT